MRAPPHPRPARAAPPLAALLVVLASCGGPPAEPPGPPELPPADVRLSVVEAGPAARIVRATGTFAAEEMVTVAAKVSGRLAAVLRDIGDRVRPGEVLCNVDETDYVLDRDRQRRAVTEALARIGLDRLPEGDVDFETLPTVERARLEAANARARLDRAKVLRDRTPPLISEQDFDDARTAWDVAESGRRIALLEAQAALALARTRQADADASEQRLRDATHVVPSGVRPPADPAAGAASDGTDRPAPEYLVAERHVAVGDYVQVGRPLFRLVDADPLRLRLRVPERRMEGVAPGRPVRVSTAAAAAAAPVTGRVTRIRPEVDDRTRTVEVEVLVPNPDLHLAVGAFATAEIDVGTDEGVALVPPSAVRTFAGVRKVLTVKDGRIAERVVTLGRTVGDRVEIVSGIAAGESFVVDPAAELASGRSVRVVGSAAGAAEQDR